jgi:hypothetical protein
MLRAGVAKFYELADLEIGNAETVAYAIFTAMASTSPALGSLELLDRTEFPVK